jgi:DNA invertase Pin-like site-specific DNA recombinase
MGMIERCVTEIRDYASRRGFKIEKTCADTGKSFLSLEGRDALKQLIKDVESGDAQFSTIIVYDVSRLGPLPGR